MPSWLERLDAASIPPSLPLHELLVDSVYYPSCAFDGTPVRILGGNSHSFVYVDYGVSEEELIRKLASAPFRGYRVMGSRSVRREELVPGGWVPRPPRFGRGDDPGRARMLGSPFARWVLFERESDFGAEHGPRRFSLLYVNGDGVATYQAIYHEQRCAPLAVCIIQPGTGFGGNWSRFEDPDGPFAEVVIAREPALRPTLLMYGGWADDPANYRPAPWPEFDEELDCSRQGRTRGVVITTAAVRGDTTVRGKRAQSFGPSTGDRGTPDNRHSASGGSRETEMRT